VTTNDKENNGDSSQGETAEPAHWGVFVAVALFVAVLFYVMSFGSVLEGGAVLGAVVLIVAFIALFRGSNGKKGKENGKGPGSN